MLNRTDPYAGQDLEAVLRAVADPATGLLAPVRPSVPVGTPSALQCLLAQCWAEDAAERPGFREVVKELAGLDPLAGGRGVERTRGVQRARRQPRRAARWGPPGGKRTFEAVARLWSTAPIASPLQRRCDSRARRGAGLPVDAATQLHPSRPASSQQAAAERSEV